jgi:hypothetical protein
VFISGDFSTGNDVVFCRFVSSLDIALDGIDNRHSYDSMKFEMILYIEQ